MLGEEVVSQQALGPQVPGDGEGEHDVGPGQGREVAVGARRHGGAPRVDHGQARACLPRLLHERWEVRVRHGRVRTPDDDVAGVHDVVRVG
jgi:hypothetical protein